MVDRRQLAIVIALLVALGAALLFLSTSPDASEEAERPEWGGEPAKLDVEPVDTEEPDDGDDEPQCSRAGIAPSTSP